MIDLQPHQKCWLTQFNDEKQQIKHALDQQVLAIEHIGSTAVPTISAKPIIDIMVGVHSLTAINDAQINKIIALGYQYIPTYEKNLPHRRFFQKRSKQDSCGYHIHLVNYHSAWWQRHILFRDFLRAYPTTAKKYEALKIELAQALNNNDQAYFFQHYISQYPALITEYNNLKRLLGHHFTAGNQYALAKSPLIQTINTSAYYDFTIHQPDVCTARLNGYIPQLACLTDYIAMFTDLKFVQNYGVKLTYSQIKTIIERDLNYWDQFGFGPYVWFDKTNQQFIGEGGLNHTHVDGQDEIELTYSLKPEFWGNGYATEIGHFAITQAFKQLTLKDIVCFTIPTNLRSLAVINKLKFDYEKEFLYHQLQHKLFRLTNKI